VDAYLHYAKLFHRSSARFMENWAKGAHNSGFKTTISNTYARLLGQKAGLM